MIDIIPFLEKVLSVSGLSNHEAPAREIIAEAWKPLCDEMQVSRLGSLHALRRGSGPEPRPRLLMMAHMDAIGLMVTGIKDGFLRFTQVGGVDPRILPGQMVTVHGREDLPAMVVQPAVRLLPPGFAAKPVSMEHLLIDTGLLPADVARLVRVGDLVSFAQPPVQLGKSAISGHTLDNRASVAAVTVCLDELQKRKHVWDVWAVASVSEEETLGGAFTSAFELRPDLAIVIDVTFAKGPGANEFNTYPLGKGVALGWGANVHPALHTSFKELAETLEIPIHMELMPRMSGTDAMGVQVAAEGIPCMVLGIPLRYMHTPVETVGIKDILRTGRLMAEFISRAEADFVQKITWDK